MRKSKMGCSIESKLEHTSPGPGRTIFSSSFVSLSIIISTLQNPFTYTIPYYKYNSTLFAFSLFSSLLSLLLRNLRTEHNRALQLSLSLMASQASLLLQKQLKDLCKNPVDGFSAGLVDETNIFEWSVTIIGPPDTLYEGGFFNAIMSFPPNYPNSPPSVKFTSELWHPNVYPDGRVCISILHPPGDDPNGYELASERWTPVHTVESIVLSIISMLSSPNDESPANVEAAKEWRDRRDEFKKKDIQLNVWIGSPVTVDPSRLPFVLEKQIVLLLYLYMAVLPSAALLWLLKR
ncbi:Ubiquitin-conjugating enzyme E2 7 [Glycine soja]